jgi:hypothetical protein
MNHHLYTIFGNPFESEQMQILKLEHGYRNIHSQSEDHRLHNPISVCVLILKIHSQNTYNRVTIHYFELFYA